MQRQKRPQQLVNLQVRVQASNETFPGIEVADVLEEFAKHMRVRAYSDDPMPSKGAFYWTPLDGGVEYELTGIDNDGTN